MANRKKITHAANKAVRTKKTPVTCWQCAHALYMRSLPNNPIVVLCRLGKGRYVLSQKHYCDSKLETTLPKLVSYMVLAGSKEEVEIINNYKNELL